MRFIRKLDVKRAADEKELLPLSGLALRFVPGGVKRGSDPR